MKAVPGVEPSSRLVARVDDDRERRDLAPQAAKERVNQQGLPEPAPLPGPVNGQATEPGCRNLRIPRQATPYVLRQIGKLCRRGRKRVVAGQPAGVDGHEDRCDAPANILAGLLPQIAIEIGRS